jgi:Tfp pilus assembly protein PilX
MRLSSHIRNRYICAEHGFSMIVVMGVMAASSLFVAAAFAAANGDLPLTRDSQDRKQAYSAAEAGINYYQYHLNQDPDYWTKCTNVPAPNATENQPVNQAWNGTTPTNDPRRWRKVAGTKNSYTIELLPANGNAACVENNYATMIDSATSSFKVRATGKSGANTKLKRSIVASFRRRSFLDFLYFTDFETTDPINYSSANQAWAQANCADKYRAQRDDNCSEIQFADADAINGPMHTNDDILTCGTPTFGRNSADSIEMTGPGSAATPGYTKVGGGCPGGDPVFNGPKRAGVKALTMPPTNSTLQTVAAAGGLVYTGKTIIRFNSGGNMTVTNALVNGGSPQTRALPANGVIYVKNNTGNCGTIQPPSNANYAEGASCGNLYISGTYTSSMTLASANDIIIAPPGSVPLAAVTSTNPVSGGSGNADLIGSGNSVLGLVANNFVRVFHPCSPEVSPLMKTVRIDAAILSLAHSFTADNYDCGTKLDLLTINGAIAQKYRGAVGTTGGTGFTKNYNYDDRLRYRSPPYFLEPVAASWHVIRSNEQVPPR